MRLRKQTNIILTCLLCVLFPAAFATAVPDHPGQVTRVYDGDTIEVAGFGKVRLLGIDVPERKASTRDRYFTRQGVKPHTLRKIHSTARELVIEHSYGQTVSLTTERPARDAYGRMLAYVTLPDGRMLNKLLLEQGCAVVYRRFNFSLKKQFLQAEEEARRNRRGMWAKP
jgi:micrococcal nuclease